MPATDHEKERRVRDSNFAIVRGSVLHMIEYGPARKSEAVLVFLKTEVDASRYGETILALLQGVGASREQLIDILPRPRAAC